MILKRIAKIPPNIWYTFWGKIVSFFGMASVAIAASNNQCMRNRVCAHSENCSSLKLLLRRCLRSAAKNSEREE